MNILAIDFGKKRLGLAWVQSGIDVILPFGVVKAENALAELSTIIAEEGIDRIVIGQPKALDGGEGEMEGAVREFGQKLAELSGRPVVYVDERFTSKQADAMGGAGASRDEKAAMLILETYLASLI